MLLSVADPENTSFFLGGGGGAIICGQGQQCYLMECSGGLERIFPPLATLFENVQCLKATLSEFIPTFFVECDTQDRV